MASSKAIVLGVGKVAVLAFALAAAGYLVVNAQRRANGPASAKATADAPSPPAAADETAAHPEAAPAAVAAPDAADLLVAEPVIEMNAPEADPTFLLSTKVGVFTDMNGSLLPVEVETEVEPEPRPVYLEGSKSMRLDVKRVTPPQSAPGKP